ncbi:MAG: cyclic nucleotide-binding domain-containing protein [Oscillospiraceae bacterium]|nr:cyclic nucleotide-binding domain-containing protein [Oscillospiraceae bacterium]
MDKKIQAEERTYKKGDIIYREGDMDFSIYDILWGRVAVYVDYGTEKETLLTEVGGEGFLGMVGFLESRPQNTTAVALEKTVVAVITFDSFGAYFQQRPAKVLSIMQYMSSRMRELTKGYLAACHALEEHADEEVVKEKRPSLYNEQLRLYDKIFGFFGVKE